jgi:hypothetical protein
MKKNLYYSEFFYLNIKKKIIDMIQKVKKKKWECFDIDCYWKYEKMRKSKWIIKSTALFCYILCQTRPKKNVYQRNHLQYFKVIKGSIRH